MGYFNREEPINETRHETVPAQPGWFVFEWEGAEGDVRLTMAPIVAWSVETEFWPGYKWETHSNGATWKKPTGQQELMAHARPIHTGGVDTSDEYRQMAVGPDGRVFDLIMGTVYPNIDAFVAYERAKFAAQEAEDELAEKVASLLTTKQEE